MRAILLPAPSGGTLILARENLLLLAAFTLALVAASAQAQNPAARGTVTTPAVAVRTHVPIAVSESVATGASPFPATCGDPTTAYPGAEVEPHIAVNPLDPQNLVAAWQQDRHSNGAARGVVSAASFDGGRTWLRSQIPVSTCTGGPYGRATDPWVSFGPDGTAYQIVLGVSGSSFQADGVSALLAARSTDGGRTWSAPATLVSDTGDLFNDKETITADPTDARFVYAVWDRLRAGAQGPTLFARSVDGGATWEPAREIHDPGGTSQTIANLVGVLPDGTLLNLFVQLDDLVEGGTQASVRVIRSADHGTTWSAPIVISMLGALGARDPTTGTAIRDGSIIPQMAVAPDGAVYVVWQDARFTGLRDAIAISRSADGGRTWSTPVRVNADASVTAFTAQVHVRADGMVGVTYYDLRSDTPEAGTLLADYWLARSLDGVNWIETRLADPFDLATAPFAGGYFLGDYTGLTSSGATFIPFHARTTGAPADRTNVFAARAGPAAALAAGSASSKRGGEPAVAELRYRAQELPLAPSPESFWSRVSGNVEAAMERRLPGWGESRKRRGNPP